MSEIDDIDEMVCELLPDELCRFGYEVNGLSTVVSFSAARDAIRSALLTAPPGYVLVPVELIDAFPEINPSNYGHDDACELNAWACELVTAAAPEVK